MKIFSAALLSLLVLLAGLVIFIRFKYPATRLKQILLNTLSQRYGVTAACGRLTFNIFSGFVLENFRLLEVQGTPTAVPSEFRSPLAIERITLSYRWRALLARRLEIDEIIIAHPALRYWQAPDSSTNLHAWLAAFTDTTAAAPADTAFELPLSINLENFRVQELRLEAQMISRADTQAVRLAHCNVEISNLEIDRRSRYHARFKLIAEPLYVDYQFHSADSSSSLQYEGEVPVQLTGQKNGDSLAVRFNIAAREGRLRIGGQETALPASGVEGEAQYQLSSSTLIIPSLRVQLAEALNLQGSLRFQNQADTTWDVRIQRVHLNLEKLTELVQKQSHLQMLSAWQSWRGSGNLDMMNSFWRQEKGSAKYRLEVAGEQINLVDSVSRLALNNTDLKLQWESAAGPSSSGHSDLTCQLAFATCALPLGAQNILATGPAQLRAEMALNANYFPYRGELAWQWRNFAGGNLHGQISLEASSDSTVLAIDTKTFVQIAVDSLALAPLLGGHFAGLLRHVDFKIQGENLKALTLTGAIASDTLTYFTTESFGKIPPYEVRLSAQLNTDAAFSKIEFTEGNLRLPPALARFRGNYEASQNKLSFALQEGQLAMAPLLALLPQDLVADSTFPFMAGTAQLKGQWLGQARPSGEYDYRGNFAAEINDGVYADTLSGIFAEQLQFTSTWRFNADSTWCEYAATCPALRLDYSPTPLPPVQTTGEILVSNDQFRVQKGKLQIPAWSSASDYTVQGRFLPGGMQVTTTVGTNWNPLARQTLGKTAFVKGVMNARFVLQQYLPDDLTMPQPARLDGQLHIEHLDFEQDSSIAIHDLSLHADIAQDFDLLTHTLTPDASQPPAMLANAGEAMLLDEVLAAPLREPTAHASQLQIKELQFGSYVFQNISSDLFLGNGRLEMKQLHMNLFEGNLVGNILLGLGDGNPDNLSYSLRAQLSSIDVSRLRRLGAQVEKGSRLSADLFLQGRGASAQNAEATLENLTGALNISKIESKVASNLLQALDPKGTEVGVQRMRLLLKTGWNVKFMKFEVKNGFVNPSISLIKTKPWTALFNLPSELDYARFPLRYFLQTGTP